LHDNTPAHRVLTSLNKLAYPGFQYLDHPPYSPDLAPLDYHLFSGLKQQLTGRHFLSDTEVIAAAETCWTENVGNFFEWLAEVRERG
jgi:histone-lysine N-methyltransferase SETMAR